MTEEITGTETENQTGTLGVAQFSIWTKTCRTEELEIQTPTFQLVADQLCFLSSKLKAFVFKISLILK